MFSSGPISLARVELKRAGRRALEKASALASKIPLSSKATARSKPRTDLCICCLDVVQFSFKAGKSLPSFFDNLLQPLRRGSGLGGEVSFDSVTKGGLCCIS